jgi:hypothetical protein
VLVERWPGVSWPAFCDPSRPRGASYVSRDPCSEASQIPSIRSKIIKMRLVAIALNTMALISALYLLTINWPLNENEIIFAAIFSVAPISSLFVLFGIGGEGWIAMYLKRKALEEKKKIENLKGSTES